MSEKANEKNIERIIAAFKALSNETRLKVFEQIILGCCQANIDKELRSSVCNVASNFNISLSTISHHIKELRNADLIRCERQGQAIL